MRSSSSWTHVNSELLAESSTSTLSTSSPPGAGAGTSPHLSLWLHSKRIHCALVNYIDSLVICSRWFTWAMKLTSLVWMFYLTFLALKAPVSTFCLDLNIGNIWDGAVQPPNPVPPDHLLQCGVGCSCCPCHGHHPLSLHLIIFSTISPFTFDRTTALFSTTIFSAQSLSCTVFCACSAWIYQSPTS